MSRNNNEESLGAVIEKLLKAYGLEDGYVGAEIISLWEKMMGPAIARRTQKLELKNGVLIVQITSAALRQELSYGKEKIAEQINKQLGKRVVKSVELR